MSELTAYAEALDAALEIAMESHQVQEAGDVPEREQFLDDLIVTLIENFHTLTWFRTHDYVCPEDGPVTATIVDDEGKRHAITRDTMRRGIDVIRTAGLDSDGAELVNADTGQRLYVSRHHRRRVLAAARENCEDRGALSRAVA